VPTEVWVCRACGHVQSPDLPDLHTFYDQDYRISLQSNEHDQLYELSTEGPVFRTAHQAGLLSELDLPEGAAVLDFGAGKATTTRRLAALRPDIRPHVFDVSECYQSHWADWLPTTAQATYVLPSTWYSRFDLITAHFVLEHTAIPVAVLADLARCLAPNGRLFFTVPDPITNPGDLLVVDHLNHFTVSSIHTALAASGLFALSLRQDQFRGAHVVLAAAGQEANVPQAANPELALSLLRDWSSAFAALSTKLDEPEMANARVAIYGAGFYGALFAPMVGARLVGFLDRNPHLLGATLGGLPIMLPEDCPPVDLIIAAVNPIRARLILPSSTNWLPSGARIFYPGEG
jgi:SAM-dependent methyltransferase